MNKQKIIAFDLDDVICFRSNKYEDLGKEKYSYCQPHQKVIDMINSLYDDGYKIIVYTARGMSQFSGNIDKIYSQLFNKTTDQLKSWGVNYHQLVMGKIHYDILIDDKVMNSFNITKENIVNFLK